MPSNDDKDRAIAANLKAEELLERCGANALDDPATLKHVKLMAHELTHQRSVVFDKEPTYIDESLKTSYIRAIVEENLILITQLDTLNTQIANLTQTVEQLRSSVARMNGGEEAAPPAPSPKHAAAPKHASTHRHAAAPKPAAESPAADDGDAPDAAPRRMRHRDPFTDTRDSDAPRGASEGW